MYSPHQNSFNKSQLIIAIQQMVEVHAELIRVLTQNLINSDSKELPLECSKYWMIIIEWYK
jgi:hypothetical protein